MAIHVNELLPGTNAIFNFAKWRFGPIKSALLFNFKTAANFEVEVIRAISSEYGQETIASARQLKCETLASKKWMVIEVLFTSSTMREAALRHGLTFNDKLYMPITTCTQTTPCTVIAFYGLPLQSQNEALHFAAARAQDVLSPSNTADTNDNENCIVNTGNSNDGNTAENLKSKPLRRIKSTHVWLQTNQLGVYCGNATVIVDGFDEKMSQKKSGSHSFAYYPDAPGYPLLEMQVRCCHMYCIKCRTINHHTTEDCLGVAIADLYNVNDDQEDGSYDQKQKKSFRQQRIILDDSVFGKGDDTIDPDFGAVLCTYRQV